MMNLSQQSESSSRWQATLPYTPDAPLCSPRMAIATLLTIFGALAYPAISSGLLPRTTNLPGAHCSIRHAGGKTCKNPGREENELEYASDGFWRREQSRLLRILSFRSIVDGGVEYINDKKNATDGCVSPSTVTREAKDY